MEPSTETFTEMGRLCVAWSALEYVSEHTLWGILQADEKWGEIISARRDLEMFWKLILEHAPKTLTETDVDDLRSIKREIEKVALDRNIIVHDISNSS
jgi:hypothetical protein